MPPEAPSVIVMDRESVEHNIPVRDPHIVISIYDPGSEPAKVRRNPACLSILSLAFDDATPREELDPKARLMNKQHAKLIWQFVSLYRHDATCIIVHCEAGWSRSPAVAAAIAKQLGSDHEIFFQEYKPNWHVFELLTSTANTYFSNF